MDKVKGRRLWLLGRAATVAALLAGCRNDGHQPSPLAVSDYRLGAIEQRVSRMDPADIDDEMLAVDAEAYGRPAGAAFRDAVTKFYNAAHPACLAEPSEAAEDEDDSVTETKAPIEDFDALVAGLPLTPFRRDLDLAWERAALAGRKARPSHSCAAGDATQHETLRDAQAAMRDALDRMELAINGSAG